MLIALSVPPGNQRGPQYMEQALAAIHQANLSSAPLEFELCEYGGAVTLFCRVDHKLRAVVEQQLYAAYPDLRIVRLNESNHHQSDARRTWAVELKLKPDLFPLKRYGQFEDALNRRTVDPLNALLNPLAASAKAALSCRIVLSVRPAHARWHARAEKCLARLVRPFFRSHDRLAHFYARLALSRRFPLRLCASIMGHLPRTGPRHGNGHELHTSGSRMHEREDDLQAARAKIRSLLFDAQIKLLVDAPAEAKLLARAKLLQMAAAFGVFHATGLAAFRASRVRRHDRLWWDTASFLLSTEELATLFHLPTETVLAPTLLTVGSRELEPPVVLPVPAEHPNLPVLGLACFRAKRQPFGILPDDRRRHVFIVGKTGMGKTSLLHRLIASDLRANRGLALIDPHGDLCDAILGCIPSRRTNDVVLFDAGDAEHPCAFNVLHCEDPRQRPLVASGIISAFKKLHRDSWGPRLEHILRNALLALLETPGTTLLSLARLLSDARYRTTVVSGLSDPTIRAFWEREFAAMHPRLQAEALAPVQNKVGAFISSPLLRNIVSQSRSTIDLRRIMDRGQILLVNLSKGRMGEDASSLLGALLVSTMQIAAMSRADRPEYERSDFSLYVDEFQNYATESFATMLSEARKYRLNLTIANQYLAQMDEATLNAVFGNVGTIVSFQVGAQDAEMLGEQFGEQLRPQDLRDLPRYHAYVRLLVEGVPSKPFSMKTLAPPASYEHVLHANIIRRTSRQRYARSILGANNDIERAYNRV